MGEVLEAYPSALFAPDTLGGAPLRPLHWSAGDLLAPITRLARTRSYASVMAHTRRAQGEAAPFSF